MSKYECPVYSSKEGPGFSGLSVCGEIEPASSRLLIRVRKAKGISKPVFAEGEHAVFLSGPGDDSCQPRKGQLISDSPLGIGTEELEFAVDHLPLGGGRYCIVSSSHTAFIDIDNAVECPALGGLSSRSEGWSVSPSGRQEASEGLGVRPVLNAADDGKDESRVSTEEGEVCHGEIDWKILESEDYTSDGFQHNAIIHVPISLTIRKRADFYLEGRVCKVSDRFLNDVVLTYAWVNPSAAPTDGVGLHNTAVLLRTRGSECSNWKTLWLPRRGHVGERYALSWMLVSPATSRSGWDELDCTSQPGSGGTCFFGAGIVVEIKC